MKFGRLGIILATIIVIFFALNPETLEMALFINAVGFDIYVLLLEIQLLAIGSLLIRYSLRPLFNFFLGFSMHTFIWPSWDHFKRDPASLAFAFPPGAILMFLLFSGLCWYMLCWRLFTCI